jgi:hypothetical protein
VLIFGRKWLIRAVSGVAGERVGVSAGLAKVYEVFALREVKAGEELTLSGMKHAHWPE